MYNLPDKFFSGIDSKVEKFQSKIEKQTEKYLRRLEKEEKKIHKKLSRTDSLAASKIFGEIDDRYNKLRQQLKEKTSGLDNLNSIYSGHLDSMKTTLKFLQQDKLLNAYPAVRDKMEDALEKYKSMQYDFVKVQEIRKYLKERQQQLQSKLEEFGLVKNLREFKKQVYYYRAQMDEYRNMFNDPSKLERKVLEIANKVPAFKDFFNKHSDLAALFRVPSDYGSLASLQGLQSRANVQQLIQQRVAAGGPDAEQLVQQNIQQALSELTQLKEKLNQLGKGSSEADLPDFKPNNQKTKSFFQRLEFGTNLQTVKSNGFYPATTDLGLSVGYKLNDRSVLGIGGSYKFGLGSIDHIVLTHEGIGLRSFIDWKIKGSFWISGGGEVNYRSQFEDLSIFQNYSAWQRSALLGLSKKYTLGKKWKGNVQLLYDFLHAQQVPRMQAFMLRFGYTFK
jgi:hypothetical protein